MSDLFDRPDKSPGGRDNRANGGRSKDVRDGRMISIRGAREHNLKDIDLDLPRDRVVVFTGLSGSGRERPER
jgi:hypothetical protein